MSRNSKEHGALHSAKPTSGDLVDRFLQGKLRAVLFGAEEELRLGRLRIEGSLGRGGMGTILSAFDPVLDRHVAIKSLLPDLSEDRDILLREARMLAKLDHANVVSIYDVVEDDDGLYLVMEQVEGGDLRAWMDEDRPWQDVVDVFVRVGRGLAAAHAIGISHCDVKPDNVMISDGRPRLIDFGLAHQRSAAPSNAGTKAYLAPEREAGGGGSAAADQFAFFASLVEAIEGKRVGVEEPWQRMPRWLAKVARRGMNADPTRRFADMNAALAALEPRRIRTTIVLATALAATAATAAFLASTATEASSESLACTGAQQLISDIWSEHTQATMKASFASTGVKQAPATWAKVQRGLDTYVTNWVRLRTDSCVATRVHKERSAQLMDFSMRCFDRRLLTLASVTELFSKSDAAVVAKAEETVTGLEDLDECIEPTALERAVPLPEGVEARQKLRHLQERYEKIKNLDRRGKHKQALANSESLASEAIALGYPPLTVRVVLLRGALQVTLNDLAGAEKTFRKAASFAARARDDRKLAEVWIRVMGLLARQARYDQALTLEPVAVTSAERVPDDLEIQARLHNTLGRIYLAKARYRKAYTAYEKALALQRKIGTDGNRALTSAMANFGLAKWYTGDLKGAMANLQQALTRSLSELGPDHSRVAYVRQNIADLYRGLGQPQKSGAHYAEVLRIWKKSLGPTHPNLAYPLEQLALLAKSRGEFDTARKHIAKAVRLREAGLGKEHPLVVQSLNVVAKIAIAEGTKASLAHARQTLAKAMALKDKLGAAGNRYTIYLLESRVQIAELDKDWRAALRDLATVVALRTKTLGAKHRNTGNSHAKVGSIQLKLGQLDQAHKSFLTAQRIYDAYPGVRDGDSIAMRQGRAQIRVSQRKFNEAITILSDALARARQAKLNQRAYQMRYLLATTHHEAGRKKRATADMRALRAQLPSKGQQALAVLIDKWLAKQ